MELAFCTQCTKRFLPFALTLCASIRQHHPESAIYVLVVDTPKDELGPELVQVHLEDLDIPHLRSFLFKYSAQEVCGAVRPFLMRYLLQTQPVRKLVYLDADTLVLAPFTEVAQRLEQAPVLLTPQILSPQGVGSDIELMVARLGAFNSGFIAVDGSATAHAFLQWWGRKLYHFALFDPAAGMHLDQKWLDLVPALFPTAGILHSPGYNVAPWNLAERQLALQDKRWRAGNEPCYFYHFSGIDVQNRIPARHFPALTLPNLGPVSALYETYFRQVEANGFARLWPLRYRYELFPEGTEITRAHRRAYWRSLGEAGAPGNPFATFPRRLSGDGTWGRLHQGVRRRTKKYLRRLSLRLLHPSHFARERDYLAAFAKKQREVYFVQIGAHDGQTDDHLMGLVKANHWKGILVEPVKYLFQRLQHNYNGTPGLIFENVAISSRRETRPFYRLRETQDRLPHWYDQLGSFNKEVVLSHRAQIPGIEKYLLEEQVDCLPPTDLIERHGFPRVDVMLVDTEGADFEVLQAFDFGRFTPAVLVYEQKHLSAEDQRRCRSFLRRRGYSIHNLGDNNVALHQPGRARLETALSRIIDD